MEISTEYFTNQFLENPTYDIKLYSVEKQDGKNIRSGAISLLGHHLENMENDYETGYVHLTEHNAVGGFETYAFEPAKQQVINDAKQLIDNVEWDEYDTAEEDSYEIEVKLGPASWNTKLPTDKLTEDHPVSELLDRYYESQK